MTLTQNPHDSFRWLAARVILLSATPVALLALVVSSLLFTAYGSDAQRPFGALVHAVTKQAQSVPEALRNARDAFPSATVIYIENGAVVQSEGEVVHHPVSEEAAQLAATLQADEGLGWTIKTVTPPFPGSIAMAAVALQFAAPEALSRAVVVATPLGSLFPQMEFAWGMTLIVSGVLAMLLIYNSLVFSGYVQQKLSSEELRRRALERRMVEANRLSSLGTLAAGIAHEINNPVSIMTQEAGWIEDLTEDNLPREELAEKVRTSAQTIRTQGARCRDITHNLLRLSRQGAVEAAPVDLNQTAEEVAALSKHRCTRQGVTLTVRTQPGISTAYAAQAHVQQILMNLVGNALDAMQNQEHGTLSLFTWEESDRVCIAVADSGPGMSEAIRSRIFEPFFTTKPSGKGTGLGLAICYGLARRNKGTLSVRSAEGEGTIFVLALPRMETDEDMLAEQDNEDENRAPAEPEQNHRPEGDLA
ncbi:HAMP domain-containing histidine kinase [Desulfovibrio mangrovi]|uniref:sensor histidine kinase n=1 Tax=Desulfovibrio mangrovi TaxID=2976983 RepID=UPI002247E882|nr:HAMP domain-containing sensor histidine kinase [Desulfovibrio mangrovi]UZP66078.1 HAMP domain-containing histidine kinase [Desulfovibrio mangrovi]